MKTYRDTAIVATLLLTAVSTTHAATVALPTITVTSMGTHTVLNKGNPLLHTSGYDSNDSTGTATTTAFTGATIDSGDTIQLTFLAGTGNAFFLQPGYGTLQFSMYLGNGGANFSPSFSIAFIGLSGGSAPVFSAINSISNSSGIAIEGNTTAQPSAPITFTGLEISWVAPSAVTAGALSLANSGFYTNSTPPDSAAFLSLQSVPEPSSALLCGLGLLCFLQRKR